MIKQHRPTRTLMYKKIEQSEALKQKTSESHRTKNKDKNEEYSERKKPPTERETTPKNTINHIKYSIKTSMKKN